MPIDRSRLLGVLVGVMAAATVLAALLASYELHQTTRDARHARFAYLNEQAVQVLEQSLHLGLPLEELQAMPTTLSRLASSDALITHLDVVSPSGLVMYSSVGDRVKAQVPQDWLDRATHALGGRWGFTDARETVLGRQVSNSFNLRVATVVVAFDEREALAAGYSGFSTLVWVAGAAGLLSVAALWFALSRVKTTGAFAGDWRVMLALGVAIAAMMGSVAWTAYTIAAPSVISDAQRKVDLLTRGLAARLQQAHQLGLPLNQVPGVEAAIRDLMTQNPEIAQAQVRSNGVLLAGVGTDSDVGMVQTRLELAADPPIVLSVRAGVDPKHAQRLLLELAADLLILLIVVVFLAREFLYVRMGQHAGAASEVRTVATEGVTVNLGGLRLPFLLLMMAEDFSRGFMPILGASLPMMWVEVSRPLALGVPLAVFMACVALSQPLLGGWVGRAGVKRVFVTGAVLSAASQALSAVAPTWELLIVCRAGAGVAWALVFIGTQAALLANPHPVTRAQQLAAFVTVIMVSLVCGPALGGFVADAFGHRAALFAASGLAVTALVVVWRARLAVRKNRPPIDVSRPSKSAAQRSGWGDDSVAAPSARLGWSLLRNPQFLGLVVLAAMPAKLMLVALCFYWVPVLAAEAGQSAAMAGRLMMIYAVVMVVCAPWAVQLSQALRTKLGSRTEAVMVCAGLLLSSVAGFGMWSLSGLIAVAWAMLFLGLGQSLGITTQVGVLQQVARTNILTHGPNPVFGYYRLAERTGSALAPLVCAGLTAAVGLHSSLLVVAVAALVCAVLFAGVFVRAPELASRAAL